jgi:hypothetical protein
LTVFVFFSKSSYVQNLAANYRVDVMKRKLETDKHFVWTSYSD